MRRLSTRLFLSHVLVAVLGAVTTFAIVRFGAAVLFERGIGAMGGMGRGQGEVREAFVSAVDTAMVFGVVVSLLAAVAASAVLGRRLLRPVDDVRAAARQIAQGDYAHRVPVPDEVELAALADDVNALGAALADTESRRVRLLGDLAHELRTPLTVMEGQIEGALDGVFVTDPDFLRDLEREVTRMRRLTADLADLSRVEEGALRLATDRLDLGEVADEAVGRLSARLASAGIEVGVDVPDEPVSVFGDGQRLFQVVTNLVDNARRAMPEGGRLLVAVSRSDGDAELRVADTGSGLRAEDLERVFERFYRAPGPGGAAPRDGGTGIGLTISRGLVRAMGGTLTAASGGEGQGAEFTITLPLARGG